MPLSDHEQRLLEQMERALYAEDPKFASALEGTASRTHARRRIYQSAAGFLVGVALLMGGLVAHMLWLSVLGFLVMLACAVFAGGELAEAAVEGGRSADRAAGRGEEACQAGEERGFVDRMEARWQRRRDQQTGF